MFSQLFHWKWTKELFFLQYQDVVKNIFIDIVTIIILMKYMFCLNRLFNLKKYHLLLFPFIFSLWNLFLNNIVGSRFYQRTQFFQDEQDCQIKFVESLSPVLSLRRCIVRLERGMQSFKTLDQIFEFCKGHDMQRPRAAHLLRPEICFLFLFLDQKFWNFYSLRIRIKFESNKN